MSWFSEYRNLEIAEFLEYLDSQGWFWAVKRLSGNDTGLTGGHQVGLYLPRWFFEGLLPEICTKEVHNPSGKIEFYFPSHDIEALNVNAIYYNAKFFPTLGLKKPYDEFRITRWGGRSTPIQQHENTGGIIVIAGRRVSGQVKGLLWCTRTLDEESVVENWLGGEVLPGEVYGAHQLETPGRSKGLSEVAMENIKDEWLTKFPTGMEVFESVRSIVPQSAWRQSLDELLLRRRSLEYALFEEIEKRHILPRVQKGFETVEGFLSMALSVANRRKSRTGRSLELNLAAIFRDSGLRFEEQARTEGEKRPDFLFPSEKDYHDQRFPANKLHMMGAKTCCKERWRQVLSEADRIHLKHLFTLQEGVSENQLAEMKSSGVILVVPTPNRKSFPKSSQSDILDLQSFVRTVGQDQQA